MGAMVCENASLTFSRASNRFPQVHHLSGHEGLCQNTVGNLPQQCPKAADWGSGAQHLPLGHERLSGSSSKHKTMQSVPPSTPAPAAPTAYGEFMIPSVAGGEDFRYPPPHFSSRDCSVPSRTVTRWDESGRVVRIARFPSELMFTSFLRAETVTFPSVFLTSYSVHSRITGMTTTHPDRTLNARAVLTNTLPCSSTTSSGLNSITLSGPMSTIEPSI